jgi:hypothetical protein
LRAESQWGFPQLEKKPGWLPGSVCPEGSLLLLLRLLGALLAIALILLGGGLGVILRGGLGGFTGTLLLIGHSNSFSENPKTIFQVLL